MKGWEMVLSKPIGTACRRRRSASSGAGTKAWRGTRPIAARTRGIERRLCLEIRAGQLGVDLNHLDHVTAENRQVFLFHTGPP